MSTGTPTTGNKSKTPVFGILRTGACHLKLSFDEVVQGHGERMRCSSFGCRRRSPSELSIPFGEAHRDFAYARHPGNRQGIQRVSTSTLISVCAVSWNTVANPSVQRGKIHHLTTIPPEMLSCCQKVCRDVYLRNNTADRCGKLAALNDPGVQARKDQSRRPEDNGSLPRAAHSYRS